MAFVISAHHIVRAVAHIVQIGDALIHQQAGVDDRVARLEQGFAQGILVRPLRFIRKGNADAQAFGILIPHGKQHDVAILIWIYFRRPVIAGSPFHLAQGLLLIAPSPQVT
ncbi:hypothetical protein SDC9_176502 [bioreactor metagenome]|uniref:Uncharacterized protein n=1 Tax=bioreactor metagenome TaxID=1076179 RepID=A0A645GYE5_9ZZZZ